MHNIQEHLTSILKTQVQSALIIYLVQVFDIRHLFGKGETVEISSYSVGIVGVKVCKETFHIRVDVDNLVEHSTEYLL